MPRSIPRTLLATAERLPDKNALVSGSETVTFSELLAKAMATAECMRELGVNGGDRVGICMEKSIDQVYAILGVLFANAVLVPILPRLKPRNISHIVENSGLRMIVTDSSRIQEVSSFSEQVQMAVGHGELDEEWPNLAYMRRFLRPANFFDRIGADDAAIIYSSGSTGRPKGILISHRNLFDGAEIVSEYLDTRESDRIGCVLSFNFDYGLNQIWQTILKGATLYLHEFAFPNDLFNLLAKEEITVLPVMPVIISQMFNQKLGKTDGSQSFPSLRYVCTTGGRLSSEMIENLEQTFPATRIYSMFGLTEAFRGTYLPPEQLDTHPNSIGRAIPGCQILILDENGKECPPQVVGELVQRGATVTKGYWRDPENTAKVFREHPDYPGEKLVFSGDNAYKDEAGYIYFVGRRDEMIKTKGFRVSPTEVESEFTNHTAVTAAVAFAVPNVEVGEDIGCAYTTEDGAALPEKTLKQYLKTNLPNHMVPTYILHFDRFPITGNAGKYDRKEIKGIAFERLGIERGDSASGSKTARD